MTLVPNQQSAIVKVVDKNGNEIGKGFIIPPWNSFFQQFTQKAREAQAQVGASPQSFTASVPGILTIINGTISNITLARGVATFNLTGLKVIPMSIGDTVTIVYTVAPSVNFLET